MGGRTIATVRRADARGRWTARLVPGAMRVGSQRLTATVTFRAAKAPKARTLRLTFTRWRPAIVKPRFTG